jgi:hypothetical protein
VLQDRVELELGAPYVQSGDDMQDLHPCLPLTAT